MCGAELPVPQATAQTEQPTTQSKPVRDQTCPVSGPSFLGLADESNSTATYPPGGGLGQLPLGTLSSSSWGIGVHHRSCLTLAP
jgi:hypothetical protein